MTVWVLSLDNDFEGEAILGIYSTQQKANKAKKDIGNDALKIDEWEVE